jgi:hypothetical protein
MRSLGDSGIAPYGGYTAERPLLVAQSHVCEKNTLLFARFLQFAWGRNWPVAKVDADVTLRFRG